MDEERKKIKKKQLVINIIGIAIFLILSLAIVIALAPHLSKFVKDPELFKQYILDHGVQGIFIALALQVLQIIVSLVPGELVEIGSGMAFGPWFGLLLCEVGLFIGTSFVYFFSKKVGKPTVQALIGDKMFDKLSKIDQSPKRDKVLYLIYLIPGLPKDLLSYLAAFFNIGFWKFMFINMVARIPSIISSTAAGRFIINGDYTKAIIIFLVTGAFALLCYFLSDKIMNAFTKHKQAKEELANEQVVENNENTSELVEKVVNNTNDEENVDKQENIQDKINENDKIDKNIKEK